MRRHVWEESLTIYFHSFLFPSESSFVHVHVFFESLSFTIDFVLKSHFLDRLSWQTFWFTHLITTHIQCPQRLIIHNHSGARIAWEVAERVARHIQVEQVVLDFECIKQSSSSFVAHAIETDIERQERVVLPQAFRQCSRAFWVDLVVLQLEVDEHGAGVEELG